MFSKDVTFTKFLPKMCETKLQQLSHCDTVLCCFSTLFCGIRSLKNFVQKDNFLLLFVGHFIFNVCGHYGLFAKISDPAVGGTYMTMLNTLTNLGGNWPSTLALWIIDQLTWKRCEFSSNIKNISETNICDGTEQTTGKL